MMVDAHQLRDFEIVGRRAKRPAQRSAIKQQIEQQDHRDEGPVPRAHVGLCVS